MAHVTIRPAPILSQAERLRRRVRWTAVALTVVLGASGVLSWWLLDAIDLSHQDMVYGASQDLSDVHALSVSLQERAADAHAYLLSGDPAFLEARRRAADAFRARLELLTRRRSHAALIPALRELQEIEARFTGISDRAMGLRATAREAAIDAWTREVRPLQAALTRIVDELVVTERTRFNDLRSHAMDATVRGRRALAGLAVVVVLALVFLFYELATTARELLRQVAAEQQQTMFRLFDQVPVGVFVLDRGGKPFYANQWARGLLGALDDRSDVATLSTTLAAYEAGTDRAYPHDRSPLVRALRGERSEVSDMEVRRGGDVVPLHVRGAPIFAHDGSLAFAVAAFQDIRELQRAATRDPLTGLGNRASLAHGFLRERMLQERAGTTLAVAMLDLDHFKRVNDTHGHATGDLVLQRTAAALLQTLRRTDLVVRWGGEELVVVLPGVDRQGAFAALDKARQAVKAEEFAGEGGSRFHVTFSAGIVLARAQESLESAVARADELLYRAKNEGRDRIVVEAQSESAPTA